MLGNLRGIRESGSIFAVPTYFFIVSIAAADWRSASWRYVTGGIVPVDVPLPADRAGPRSR